MLCSHPAKRFALTHRKCAINVPALRRPSSAGHAMQRGAFTRMSSAPSDVVAPLFQPYELPGGQKLQNRFVYAPLTRCRAINTIPQPFMAEYYRQRAYPGSLIIAEATVVDRDGQGYPHTPGIFTEEQIAAWKPITQAVREQGATFYLQLWHSGRASHPAYQENGKLPVSSSAVPIVSEEWKNCYLGDGKMDLYPVPEPLTKEGIKQKIEAFRRAARNAMDAGFNGIELHAANGYLIDQFTKDSINQRTDEYGGCIENRCRFALEVVQAVADEIGAERVGIRLSPVTTYLDAIDSTPYATFAYLVEQLNRWDLAYLHMVESRVAEIDEKSPPFSLTPFRQIFKGPFIVNGGYTSESGARAITTDSADLVAFGRVWLANPDLPERFKLGAPLNQYDRSTFYTHGLEGYIDYPTLDEAQKAGSA